MPGNKLALGPAEGRTRVAGHDELAVDPNQATTTTFAELDSRAVVAGIHVLMSVRERGSAKREARSLAPRPLPASGER